MDTTGPASRVPAEPRVPPAREAVAAGDRGEPTDEPTTAETGPGPIPPGGGVPAAGERERDALKNLLRPVLGFLANVTVLTALLVYFGWRRAATHADRLGIDESILGMSTRDYVLRSVGPVLVLLVGIGVAGLVWLAIDQRLTPLLQSREPVASPSGRDRAKHVTLILRLLGVAWVILPVLVVLLGYPWPALAFVLFPASIGAGVLLWLYAAHLRELERQSKRPNRSSPVGSTSGRQPDAVGHSGVTLALVGLLVAVCLFWTASNYAEVLGRRLADDFAADVTGLPGVTVYSEGRLHLDGPGVDEDPLSDEGAVRYRYGGLRLLEHTGGKFFLVSDGWTTEYGVVFVLRDDDQSMRLDFVRDRR